LVPTIDPKNLPPFVDKFCDVELSKLVCFKKDAGKWEVRRALSDDDRHRLEVRAEICRAVLRPFSVDEDRMVRSAIGGLLAGFRSLREYDREAAAAQLDVTAVVLAEFPAWAIVKACLGLARQKRAFVPNDGEIFEAVAEQVRLFRRSLENCLGLLGAEVAAPQPVRGSAPPPRHVQARPLPEISPERMRAVLADCEARRARKQQEVQ
jgi:hypothetical protein